MENSTDLLIQVQTMLSSDFLNQLELCMKKASMLPDSVLVELLASPMEKDYKEWLLLELSGPLTQSEADEMIQDISALSKYGSHPPDEALNKVLGV